MVFTDAKTAFLYVLGPGYLTARAWGTAGVIPSISGREHRALVLQKALSGRWCAAIVSSNLGLRVDRICLSVEHIAQVTHATACWRDNAGKGHVPFTAAAARDRSVRRGILQNGLQVFFLALSTDVLVMAMGGHFGFP